MANIFIAEFIGTMLMVLIGNGTVANNNLKKTGGNGSGALLVTVGWAIGVMIGVFASNPISGAHLNPAVTIAFAIYGNIGWGEAPVYIIAQFAGAIVAMILVWLAYYKHWGATEEAQLKLGCFSTAPGIRSYGANLVTEIIATFVLVFSVFMLVENKVPTSIFGVVMAVLITGIGLGLGGPTGWSLNPARDLGPRIAYTFLPIPGKKGSDWAYSWVPVFGPIIGGIIAVFVFKAYSVIF